MQRKNKGTNKSTIKNKEKSFPKEKKTKEELLNEKERIEKELGKIKDREEKAAIPDISFYLKKHWHWIALILILLVAFHMRSGTLGYTNQLVIDPDSDYFYMMGEHYINEGGTPANNTMRAAPYGIEEAPLILESLVLAIVYKVIDPFTSMSLQDVFFFYPVIATLIAIIIFFFLVRELFDVKTAVFASFFFAIIPAGLFRTTAGVADHEAMALVWFFACLFFFVRAIKSEIPSKSLADGSLAGIFLGLMALTWGGFTYVLLIGGIYLFIKSILKYTTKNEIIAVCSMFLIGVLIKSVNTRYLDEFFAGFIGTLHSGTTFVAVGLLGFAITVYLIRNYKINERYKIDARFLGILICAILSIFSILILEGGNFGNFISTLANSLNPLRSSVMAQSVSENQAVNFVDVWNQINGVIGWQEIFAPFTLALVGLGFLLYSIYKRNHIIWQHILYPILLLLFLYLLDLVLYIISGFSYSILGFLIILLLYLVYKGKLMLPYIHNTEIFALVWLFVSFWSGLSGSRLIFMISYPVAVFAGIFLVSLLFFYQKENSPPQHEKTREMSFFQKFKKILFFDGEVYKDIYKNKDSFYQSVILLVILGVLFKVYVVLSQNAGMFIQETSNILSYSAYFIKLPSAYFASLVHQTFGVFPDIVNTVVLFAMDVTLPFLILSVFISIFVIGFAKFFDSQKKLNFKQVFGVIGFAMLPGIFFVIPVFGTVIGAIWIGITLIVAISVICDFSKVNSFALFLIALLLFFFVASAFYESYTVGEKSRIVTGPGLPSWYYAYQWIQNNTQQNDIIAHWWDYGYWTQMWGHRASTLDGGQPLFYGNNLIAYTFFTTPYENDSLEYCRTHNVSYVMIFDEDVGKFYQIDRIGGRPGGYGLFQNPQTQVEGNYTWVYYVGTITNVVNKDEFHDSLAVLKLKTRINGNASEVIGAPEIVNAAIIDGKLTIPKNEKFTQIKNICTEDGITNVGGIVEGCVYILNSNLIVYSNPSNMMFAQLYFYDAKNLEHFKLVYNQNGIKIYKVIY